MAYMQTLPGRGYFQTYDGVTQFVEHDKLHVHIYCVRDHGNDGTLYIIHIKKK